MSSTLNESNELQLEITIKQLFNISIALNKATFFDNNENKINDLIMEIKEVFIIDLLILSILFFLEFK